MLSSQPRMARQANQAEEEEAQDDKDGQESAAWASLVLVPMDVATMAIIAVVILNRLMSAINSNSQTKSIVGGIAGMDWGDPSIDPESKAMFYMSKVEVQTLRPLSLPHPSLE